MQYYPAVLHPHSGGGYWATFVQEAVLTGATQGEDETEVMAMLDDLLLCNLVDYFNEGKIVPDPIPLSKGQVGVPVSTQLEAKILLHNERVKRGLSKAELGRLAGLTPVEIGRVLNPRYGSKMEVLDKVMNALGLRFWLMVV